MAEPRAKILFPQFRAIEEKVRTEVTENPSVKSVKEGDLQVFGYFWGDSGKLYFQGSILQQDKIYTGIWKDGELTIFSYFSSFGSYDGRKVTIRGQEFTVCLSETQIITHLHLTCGDFTLWFPLVEQANLELHYRELSYQVVLGNEENGFPIFGRLYLANLIRRIILPDKDQCIELTEIVSKKAIQSASRALDGKLLHSYTMKLTIGAVDYLKGQCMTSKDVVPARTLLEMLG